MHKCLRYRITESKEVYACRFDRYYQVSLCGLVFTGILLDVQWSTSFLTVLPRDYIFSLIKLAELQKSGISMEF